MQPVPGGRFCESCQHQVMDLTCLADQELVNLFEQAEAPKCVRIPRHQLDRVLQRSMAPTFAFTSLLALLTGCTTPDAPKPVPAPEQTHGSVAPQDTSNTAVVPLPPADPDTLDEHFVMGEVAYPTPDLP